MKLLITGSTGLVGSRFVELLNNFYEFDSINTSTGTDILDKESLFEKVSSSNSDILIHFAAKTNVDGCEGDKKRDDEILKISDQNKKENTWRTEKTAWAVNVYGMQNIVEACQKFNKKIVYISTDFVFSGQKKSYDEESKPDPINWYGETKFEAEKLVQNSNLNFLIARVAYPYRSLFEKKDFARAILERLQKHENLQMITDHVMKPTFIDDLVNALDILIKSEQAGIFHVVGSQTVTPYEAAIKIANKFNLDESVISKTIRREYFAGKAPRPFCLNLKNDKISKLGIEMSTFDKGISEIKNQLNVVDEVNVVNKMNL